MSLTIAGGYCTAGYLIGDRATHLWCRQVIVAALPDMHWHVDVPEGKSPWLGEQVGIPGHPKRSIPERLDLAFKASMPHFWLAE